MAYTFATISSAGSAGAVRNVAVDLTGLLLTAETVSTVAVTSSDTSTLTIALAGVNGTDVDYDGTVVLADMGCVFEVTVLKRREARVLIHVEFVGSLGTEDSIEIIQPIVPHLVA